MSSVQDHFLNLQPGTIVNGRYEIVRCLGTGSMGMVYACRHRELSGHLVAMKVLFAEVARDAVAAARFRNEIVASYGVSHPNVVRAYEYFRDGDLIAFTMEYIEGGDLADRIGPDEDLEIPEILQMLAQMCAGVQAIHDAGIVHRDLKPENILITGDKDIKITDFGIARTGTGPKLTEHGGVVGTLDYVSPEYLEKGQVDARSDIYALGVMAFEMITRQSPFQGKSVIETMTMRLRTDPEPPQTLRPDCPDSLGDIVLKAMHRDPTKRYQAANEMLQDLQAFSSAALPTFHSGQFAAVGAATTSINTAIAAAIPPAPPTPVEQVAQPAASLSQEGNAMAHVESPFEDSASGETAVEEAQSDPMYSSPARMDMSPGELADRPSIAVSNSHLSSQRIQELAQDVYPEGEGLINRWLWAILIILVGLGVGFFVLGYLQPELFGGDGGNSVKYLR